ncbi:hypothetical protein ABZX90_26195 [Streptomyces sp. NPDC002935]|uniref:hypothetical protein n=1 Tax=unclassified Streptomyces TaxID=2593676 RepID=UPI003329BEE4
MSTSAYTYGGESNRYINHSVGNLHQTVPVPPRPGREEQAHLVNVSPANTDPVLTLGPDWVAGTTSSSSRPASASP